MSSWMRLVLGVVVLSVVAVIGATVLVGSKVREETVVARPYEEGLRHDAERASRAALGLAVAIEDEAPRPGGPPLAFRLSDRQGRPVAGAEVAVELSRPDTSRGEVRARAREVAPGRYAAAVPFPAPGPWDVRFDVVRGADRVRLERRLVAAARCDLGASPCSAPLEGGGEVTVELGPRPLRPMAELAVAVTVRRGGEPEDADAVELALEMDGMAMGENRVSLARRAPGAFGGTAVVVRCPSGRRDWVATVTVTRAGGAPAAVRFPLAVAERP